MASADFNVIGAKYNNINEKLAIGAEIRIQMTVDSVGKTISVGDNEIQFTMPFEPIEKAFKRMKERSK